MALLHSRYEHRSDTLAVDLLQTNRALSRAVPQIVEPTGKCPAERRAEIAALIHACRDGLAPSLAETEAAAAYAEKIACYSVMVEHREGGRLEGAVSTYANDVENRQAFVTMVAVEPHARGRGIAASLMHATMVYLAAKGFEAVLLKVMKGNKRAIELYRNRGFNVIGEDDDQFEMLASVKGC